MIYSFSFDLPVVMLFYSELSDSVPSSTDGPDDVVQNQPVGGLVGF